VDADLFVLTDQAPSLSPAIWSMPGMKLLTFGPASDPLLADLRSDKGMSWLPSSGMWLTAMSLHTPAIHLGYDLSIDGGGPVLPGAANSGWSWWAVAVIAVLGLVAGAMLWRPRQPGLRIA